MNWLFGHGQENPFAHGECRNGYFYPYTTQGGSMATEAEKIEHQWRASGWSPAMNESDRVLLMLAAKAAGIKLACPQDYDDRFRNVTSMGSEGNLLAAPVWDPLANDGDAFRLAVALGFDLSLWGTDIFVRKDGICRAQEFSRPDRCAATRRAVTRAAAEIWKAMP